MSKSLGNVYTLEDLKKQGIEPLAYRYFSYSSNFTKKLNFTWDSIKQSQNSLNKLREQVLSNRGISNKIDKNIISNLEAKFLDAINDNLNMTVALSVVYEALKNEKSNDIYSLILKFDNVLSLDLNRENTISNEKIDISENVLNILKSREEARKNKDYALSDKYRDELLLLGYIVKDTKEGQKLEKSE